MFILSLEGPPLLRSSPGHRLLTERKAYAAPKNKGGDCSPPEPMFLDTLETQPKYSAVPSNRTRPRSAVKSIPVFLVSERFGTKRAAPKSRPKSTERTCQAPYYSAKNKKAAI